MTIEEMALRDLPVYINKWLGLDINEDKRRGYVTGAKAVVEEIEYLLKQAQYYSDLSCKTQLYDDLVSLVEQLKKEE